jgi:hypothetical protein
VFRSGFSMKRSMRSGYANNIPGKLSGSQEIESAAADFLSLHCTALCNFDKINPIY